VPTARADRPQCRHQTHKHEALLYSFMRILFVMLILV
jgi:hypothetical protein